MSIDNKILNKLPNCTSLFWLIKKLFPILNVNRWIMTIIIIWIDNK